MNPIFKKILIGVLILVSVFLILLAITFGWEAWKSYKWQKSVDQWEESLRKPYKEDVWGGATPEETWGLFLDALRAGDIDLASKYFAVEKQGDFKGILEDSKTKNELEEWIKEMEGLRKSENQPLSKEKVYYFYNYFDEELKNTLSSRVVFYLNPLTKVWKILVL